MAFDFIELSKYSIWGNSVKEYLVALGIFLLALIVLKIFKFVIIKRLKKLSNYTKTKLDDLVVDVIDKVGWPFYVLLSLYVAVNFIQLPVIINNIFYYIIIITATYYGIRIIQGLIDFGAHKAIQKRKKQKKDADVSVIHLLSKIFKGILWVIAVLLILSNLGYNISSLLAGLGIGGVAIAIALQNILSDIFASFSIYFDKPFEVGDFLIIGDDLGVVKKIGIKTTRLESLWGEEIVVSNKELTSTRINNYKKMKKRRVHFNFGVVYETPTQKVKKIPGIVKKIFDKIESADLDRVHFKEFGDFSLNFEVAYYVGTGDYNKYMDTQQD
ncbi:unnamed protein product, partial [marine sediment metagenome]